MSERCDADFYCGSCPDCLSGEHPENRSRYADHTPVPRSDDGRLREALRDLLRQVEELGTAWDADDTGCRYCLSLTDTHDATCTIMRARRALAALPSEPSDALGALDEAAGAVIAMDIDKEMPGETLTVRDRAVFARVRRVAYQRIRALAAHDDGKETP